MGWKLGFGSPTGLMNLNIGAPLTGYLLADRQVPDGATIAIDDWIKPVGETEIVLYFGRDIPAGSTPEYVMESIYALGPAIELADLEFAPVDPTKILATDIFQKNYILGARDESRRGGDIRGLVAQVLLPDGSKKVVEELEELIGQLTTIVPHCAEVAAEISGGIKRDHFLLVGSLVPPISVATGDSFSFSLGGFPPLSVNF